MHASIQTNAGAASPLHPAPLARFFVLAQEDSARISSGRVGGEPECSSGDYEYPAYWLRLAGGLVAIPRGKRRSYGMKDDKMKCDECGLTTDSVRHREGMTAYHWDGQGEDPNDTGILCDVCYEEYRDYWSSMWAEYRSSQGF